jgi:hypothetical protein
MLGMLDPQSVHQALPEWNLTGGRPETNKQTFTFHEQKWLTNK